MAACLDFHYPPLDNYSTEYAVGYSDSDSGVGGVL